MKKRTILNIPNALTFTRFILTFILIYLVLAKAKIVSIVVVFIIGSLTDFFDGQIARRFNMETEFGRKLDIVADRFFFIGFILALTFDYYSEGIMTENLIMQVLLILSRELISAPSAIVSFIANKKMPHTRNIGKLVTFLQGVTLPTILLSTISSFFYFSIYLSILTGICGIISGMYYIYDLQREV